MNSSVWAAQGSNEKKSISEQLLRGFFSTFHRCIILLYKKINPDTIWIKGHGQALSGFFIVFFVKKDGQFFCFDNHFFKHVISNLFNISTFNQRKTKWRNCTLTTKNQLGWAILAEFWRPKLTKIDNSCSENSRNLECYIT